MFTVVSLEIHILDKITEDAKLLSLSDCKKKKMCKETYKRIYKENMGFFFITAC